MSEELKRYQEQQLKMMKLQTGFLAVILAVVLLTGIFLAVQVSGAVKAVDSLDMEKVGQIINSLESVATELNDVDMDAINGAVTALRDAALRDAGLSGEEALHAACHAYLAPRAADNRAHLRSAVPIGAAGTPSRMTAAEMREARELFGDLTEGEIERLYARCQTE